MDFFNKVNKTGNITRQFNYQKGKVSLNFGLRIDIKNELRDFKDLLESALEDVEAELKKHQ